MRASPSRRSRERCGTSTPRQRSGSMPASPPAWHWTRSTGHSTSPLFVSAPAEGGASSRWTNPRPSVVRRAARHAPDPADSPALERRESSRRGLTYKYNGRLGTVRRSHGRDEDDSGGGGDGTARRDGRTQPPQARTSRNWPHAKRLEVEGPGRRGNRRRSGGPHATREPHPARSECGRVLRRHDSVLARLLSPPGERGPARQDGDRCRESRIDEARRPIERRVGRPEYRHSAFRVEGEGGTIHAG